MDAKKRWGFIDKTGSVLIPCQWKKVYDFKGDHALVQDNYGNWLSINKKGEKN